jgi:hypothetical protein
MMDFQVAQQGLKETQDFVVLRVGQPGLKEIRETLVHKVTKDLPEKKGLKG